MQPYVWSSKSWRRVHQLLMNSGPHFGAPQMFTRNFRECYTFFCAAFQNSTFGLSTERCSGTCALGVCCAALGARAERAIRRLQHDEQLLRRRERRPICQLHPSTPQSSASLACPRAGRDASSPRVCPRRRVTARRRRGSGVAVVSAGLRRRRSVPLRFLRHTRTPPFPA